VRAFIGVLVMLVAGTTWAGSERQKLGENSIFSDTNTRARLQPAAEVCLKGDSCAGNAVGAEVVADSSTPKTAAEIYQISCMGCHASGIAGAPKTGDAGDWKSRLSANQGLDGLVTSAIKGKGAMPPNGTCANCSADDMKKVVEYILEESGVSADSVSTGADVNDNTEASNNDVAVNGGEVYSQRCSVCHGQGIAGAPKTGDKAAWAERLAKGSDTVYQNALNGINSMPPKGGCMDCSDEQIKAAVEYMVSSSQ